MRSIFHRAIGAGDTAGTGAVGAAGGSGAGRGGRGARPRRALRNFGPGSRTSATSSCATSGAIVTASEQQSILHSTTWSTSSTPPRRHRCCVSARSSASRRRCPSSKWCSASATTKVGSREVFLCKPDVGMFTIGMLTVEGDRRHFERMQLVAALGIDPDHVVYRRLADIDTATEKARRDAPEVAVLDVLGLTQPRRYRRRSISGRRVARSGRVGRVVAGRHLDRVADLDVGLARRDADLAVALSWRRRDRRRRLRAGGRDRGGR